MLCISEFNPCWIEWYFDAIKYLLRADEFGRAHEFLEQIEGWSKEQFTQQRQRIHRKSRLERVKWAIK